MAIEIGLWVVGLVSLVFAAYRVIVRGRPTPIEVEAPPPQAPSRRPHYVPRQPSHYALPPVTIETLPIDFKKRVPELVPPIDRGVLAALIASASGTAAEASRPAKLARGSIPAGVDYTSVNDDAASNVDDLDGAETLRPASDLDEDAMTRTHMSPVH